MCDGLDPSGYNNAIYKQHLRIQYRVACGALDR